MNGVIKIIILLYFLSFGLVVTAQATFYYAYGDSITAPDDAYINQMVKAYDPDAKVSRNTDGSGMTSEWAVKNMDLYYKSEYTFFIIEFGTNDEGLPSADNLELMYNYVKSQGSTPIILIPTLRDGNKGTIWDYETHSARIKRIETQLTLKKLPFVKMYDAIDAIPNNGRLDGFNHSNQPDAVHPNTKGHKMMADTLWNCLHPEEILTKTWMNGNVPLGEQSCHKIWMEYKEES